MEQAVKQKIYETAKAQLPKQERSDKFKEIKTEFIESLEVPEGEELNEAHDFSLFS